MKLNKKLFLSSALLSLILVGGNVFAEENTTTSETTGKTRESIRADIKKVREDRHSEIEGLKKEAKEMREQKKSEMEKEREDRKGEREDEREGNKLEKQTKAIDIRTKLIVNRLSAAVERLGVLSQRITSRIEKVKATGTDTTKASELVTTAQTTIVKANENITSIKTLATVSPTATAEEIAAQKAQIKTLAKQTEQLLKDAHKMLQSTLPTLKKAPKIEKTETEINS